jgi:cell division protein FtsQ
MIGGRSPGLVARRRASGDRRHRPGRGGPANRRRRRALRRPPPLVLAAALVILVVAGGGWLWLRDSSLVAVDQVTVTGQSGPDAGQIRSALMAAARNMTTLDVKLNQLQIAVEPYPVVKQLSVTTQFPHGMRIRVIEQVPVAVVSAGGQTIAVAGDGTLLHDVIPSASLPTIALSVVPGGTRLTGSARTEAALLAAAPYALLAKISQVSIDAARGLVVALRNGPSVYFGSADQLGAKWDAAVAVLGAPSSDGAPYIDVTDPQRPAAGGPSAGGAAPSTGPSGAGAPALAGGATPAVDSTGGG